jgi:hypothetical protein
MSLLKAWRTRSIEQIVLFREHEIVVMSDGLPELLLAKQRFSFGSATFSALSMADKRAIVTHVWDGSRLGNQLSDKKKETSSVHGARCNV